MGAWWSKLLTLVALMFQILAGVLVVVGIIAEAVPIFKELRAMAGLIAVLVAIYWSGKIIYKELDD